MPLTGDTDSRRRRRVRKIRRFVVVGVSGALFATFLHRTLDVRIGRAAVGALAGFLLGVAPDGYDVTIVQIPETSFQDDVAATKRVLDLQTEPCILAVIATADP